jgi:hypothetical protein
MEGQVRLHRKTTRQPATSRQSKRSKRSAATKPPRNRRSFTPGEDIEVARLTRERDEALEQQAAISEVLRVISASPGKLEPVFQAILEYAVRICDAKYGSLFRYDNETFEATALFGLPPAFDEYQRQHGSFEAPVGSPLDRLLRTKEVVRIADASAATARSAAGRLGGARSLMAVPMLKENSLVGAIVLYRQDLRPFTRQTDCSAAGFRRPRRNRHREHAAAWRIARADRCGRKGADRGGGGQRSEIDLSRHDEPRNPLERKNAGCAAGWSRRCVSSACAAATLLAGGSFCDVVSLGPPWATTSAYQISRSIVDGRSDKGLPRTDIRS